MAYGAETLLIAGAVASASAAAASAYSQNQAVKRSITSARRAAAVQTNQVNRQALVEAKKKMAEAERTRGRVRVAAAAAGTVVDGSSYETVLNQVELNSAVEQSIIEQNRRDAVARITSGGNAQLADLQSRMQNVGISAFNGGLAGLTAGLQINSGLQSLGFGASAASAADAAEPIANIGGAGGLPSYRGVIA